MEPIKTGEVLMILSIGFVLFLCGVALFAALLGLESVVMVLIYILLIPTAIFVTLFGVFIIGVTLDSVRTN